MGTTLYSEPVSLEEMDEVEDTDTKETETDTTKKEDA